MHTHAPTYTNTRNTCISKEGIRRLANALRFVLGDGSARACEGTMLQRAHKAIQEWADGEEGPRLREMMQFIIDGAARRGVCPWGRTHAKH